MAPNEAQGIQPELRGLHCLGELLLLGFERGDFFFADVIVDLPEVAQPSEFVFELSGDEALGGSGDLLAAFAGDFLGPADHFWQDFVFDGRLIEQLFWAAAFERSISEIDFIGDVFEGVIDGDTDGGGGEEAIYVQGGWGDAFGRETAVEEEAISLGSLPGGKGRVAVLAAEQEIERAADERVVGREESELLTREGAGAVKGDGESLFR